MQKDSPVFQIGSDFRDRKEKLSFLLFYTVVLAVNLIIAQETFQINLHKALINYNAPP